MPWGDTSPSTVPPFAAYAVALFLAGTLLATGVAKASTLIRGRLVAGLPLLRDWNLPGIAHVALGLVETIIGGAIGFNILPTVTAICAVLMFTGFVGHRIRSVLRREKDCGCSGVPHEDTPGVRIVVGLGFPALATLYAASASSMPMEPVRGTPACAPVVVAMIPARIRRGRIRPSEPGRRHPGGRRPASHWVRRTRARRVLGCPKEQPRGCRSPGCGRRGSRCATMSKEVRRRLLRAHLALPHWGAGCATMSCAASSGPPYVRVHERRCRRPTDGGGARCVRSRRGCS
ncbi:MauE/DoxX family redox-associated membrane protein [Embleya sp. MST-111070]|uniref:MauE/DoxX family redox-associated membrane protein n=1 Tax=Embleya sp. MST-111070 TaxID=3398231 RepID=UPI003F7377AB